MDAEKGVGISGLAANTVQYWQIHTAPGLMNRTDLSTWWRHTECLRPEQRSSRVLELRGEKERTGEHISQNSPAVFTSS